MITNAQWSAVRPTGLRKKKPRHLDVMRAQQGQITQQVIAGKEAKQRKEEIAFNQAQAEKEYQLQLEQYEQDKKNAERNRKMQYLNTGLTALDTLSKLW